MARAARLGAELRFHYIERDKVAALKRQEEDIKKLQIMRELAATNAELEAVTKIEEEEFGVTINKTNDLVQNVLVEVGRRVNLKTPASLSQ